MQIIYAGVGLSEDLSRAEREYAKKLKEYQKVSADLEDKLEQEKKNYEKQLEEYRRLSENLERKKERILHLRSEIENGAPVERILLDTRIDEIGLPGRVSNCLMRAGVHDLSYFVGKTPDHIRRLKMKGFGEQSMKALVETLRSLDLGLMEEAIQDTQESCQRLR